jgi:hypothetical protein
MGNPETLATQDTGQINNREIKNGPSRHRQHKTQDKDKQNRKILKTKKDEHH